MSAVMLNRNIGISALGIAAGAAALVTPAWLSGSGATAIAALFAAPAFLPLFLCAPSRVAVAAFLLFMLLTHQFRSFFLLNAAGVEWHPRELVLFLLLGHALVILAFAPPRIEISMLWLFPALYGAYFILIACVGIFRGAPQSDILAELRYGMFIASFFALAVCVTTWRDLLFHTRLVFAATLLVALAGLTFFAYTWVSGNVVNTQNTLGEYVRRAYAGGLIQSVRPNGHHFFEVAIVVLTSLLFARGVNRAKKSFYLLCIGVFAAAVAITMMRTAYAALVIALFVLAILHLPRWGRATLLCLGAAGTLAAVMLILAARPEHFTASAPELETSLRGRYVEFVGAAEQVRNYPLFGAGMGSKFTQLGFVAKKTVLAAGQVEFQNVHNVWMYYLFKGGTAGFLLVLLALGGMAVHAHNITLRLTDPWQRQFARGLLAAFAGQLIASLAMPRLTYPSGAVFIAMIAAAFLVLERQSSAATRALDR